MNRCICCNNVMTEAELEFSYDWGEPIELCIECLGETVLFENRNDWGNDEQLSAY